MAPSSGRAPPPKVEQEQVQLNVALQTEIVRFTVLGIQKAIQEVNETMAEQERLSGAGAAGGASFFVSVVFCKLVRGGACNPTAYWL
jgi:chemotaxis receptor (MCP) glutamine deamidase CheD